MARRPVTIGLVTVLASGVASAEPKVTKPPTPTVAPTAIVTVPATATKRNLTGTSIARLLPPITVPPLTAEARLALRKALATASSTPLDAMSDPHPAAGLTAAGTSVVRGPGQFGVWSAEAGAAALMLVGPNYVSATGAQFMSPEVEGAGWFVMSGSAIPHRPIWSSPSTARSPGTSLTEARPRRSRSRRAS